ncbi:PAS modulated sigma54 specific transcriptional regulator, Fis family [Candidatus Magnetomorum sp. HK-1]|nr:PAS modulated sigma54 specific transcriptional regulator, Fis family [Candidatus Magnetomorum sp. HK-1]
MAITSFQPTQVKGLFSSSIELSSLMDEIPLGIIVFDNQRRIVLINRAFEALCGFSMEHARGIPCFHVMRSKMCIQKCPLIDMGSSSESISIETDIINKDRQLIPVLINLSPIRDDHNNLLGFLETVEDLRSLKEIDSKTPHPYAFHNLIGKSPQMIQLFQRLPLLAQSDSAILITGETGTGKDMLAEAIHHSSNRAKGPFVKVNCGALPETLLESELFGHQKGAFTGAIENKPGRFRLAHNGTLFLTEIGDLPLSLQVKLLTFLDDKIVYPLGSTKGFQADVRVIAATHRNLNLMVKEKKFRKDLMFRLNVVRLHLPPLRKRGEDIRLIMDHFIHFFALRFKKEISGPSKESLRILKDYHYPGNVRELRNCIEYAVNICPSGKIQLSHLPSYLAETNFHEDEFKLETEDVHKWSLNGKSNIDKNEQKTWASLEREMIIDALINAKGRRNKAAEILGWGRSTLWRKIKQYNIDT